MPEFLIEANLPLKVKPWDDKRFIHVSLIDASWDDMAIWNYAKENKLTIISKDKDFLTYLLANGFPPKIEHIKFGNLRLKEFISVIESCWDEV